MVVSVFDCSAGERYPFIRREWRIMNTPLVLSGADRKGDDKRWNVRRWNKRSQGVGKIQQSASGCTWQHPLDFSCKSGQSGDDVHGMGVYMQ